MADSVGKKTYAVKGNAKKQGGKGAKSVGRVAMPGNKRQSGKSAVKTGRFASPGNAKRK